MVPAECSKDALDGSRTPEKGLHATLSLEKGLREDLSDPRLRRGTIVMVQGAGALVPNVRIQLR